ncbi:MAG: prepilin peptidase [Patescibacteria group bacterium]
MSFLIFIFGLAIGSFLNVLIFRLPENKTILGFSKCPGCRKRISWYDNIPVLSFLFLKGRCRRCKSKISWQYPLVELLTGVLFLVYFLTRFRGDGSFSSLIYGLFIISLLIVIGVIDFKHFIIFNKLVLTGFIAAVLILLFFPFYSIAGGDVMMIEPFCSIVSCFPENSFYGLFFFAGILLFIFLISKGRWLGFGDVSVGALLGFTFGLKNSINVFYLTFFIGFIIAIILLVFKKAGLKSKVPLGSLMALASILFLLSGFNLLDFLGL